MHYYILLCMTVIKLNNRSNTNNKQITFLNCIIKYNIISYWHYVNLTNAKFLTADKSYRIYSFSWLGKKLAETVGAVSKNGTKHHSPSLETKQNNIYFYYYLSLFYDHHLLLFFCLYYYVIIRSMPNFLSYFLIQSLQETCWLGKIPEISQQEWYKLPVSLIIKLVHSRPSCCQSNRRSIYVNQTQSKSHFLEKQVDSSKNIIWKGFLWVIDIAVWYI